MLQDLLVGDEAVVVRFLPGGVEVMAEIEAARERELSSCPHEEAAGAPDDEPEAPTEETWSSALTPRSCSFLM